MGKALGQVERQKRRLLDAYLSGVLELPELERKRKELDGRSNTLLAQKRQLEASANERIELAKIADSIEQFCKQVKEGLSSATFEQKRTLVELLIDQVVVTDEEVEIRYVIPTSPEGPHHPFCHLRTDYLPLLQNLASRGHLGEAKHCPPRAAAGAPGTKSLSQKPR
jgi:site-specific DNA recombinase